MFKILVFSFLLGTLCFSSALQTVESQTILDAQMRMQKNLPPYMSWEPTRTVKGDLLGNVRQFKSQENENEIDLGGDNIQNSDSISVTEDKQLPQQQQQPQQQITQKLPQQVPQQSVNKNPNNYQNPKPTSYAVPFQGGSHSPGFPVSQYSGIQMVGYQKEQTGLTPISHQQQMFYSGGSNSVPFMIYSDSERPPIAMFILGQGDKKIQSPVREEFISPVQPNPFMYSALSPLFNVPSSFLDPLPQAPLTMWDTTKQYPYMYENSPSQYYGPSSYAVKNTESLKNEQKQMKPKSAQNGGFYGSEIRSAEPWLPLPQQRSVISPLWSFKSQNGLKERAVLDQLALIESLERSAMMESLERSAMANEYQGSVLGSSYTSLPTSPYSTGVAGRGPSYTPGYTGSSLPYNSQSSYGQQNLYGKGGHSLSQGGSAAQNQYGHDKVQTSYIQPLPTGGHISSNVNSQKGYSTASQGQGSYNGGSQGQGGLYSGANKYQNQPGSFGNNYNYPQRLRSSGILGSALSGSNQNNQMTKEFSLNDHSSQLHKGNPPTIAIIPVDIMEPLEKMNEIPASNYQNFNQLHPTQSQIHSSQSQIKPSQLHFSNPKNAILGTQFGLGGGYGTTGLNNQYSNANQVHLANQGSGLTNNQQYGHENVNTGVSIPLPTGGQIYSQVNSDKGFSGGNFGQGSHSLGVNDQQFNSGSLNSNQGYNTGLETTGLGYGGVGLGGVGLNTGVGLGGVGLNTGVGLGGVGLNTGVGLGGTGLGGTGLGGTGLGLNNGLGYIG